MSKLTPYLLFNGNCAEAMQFYQSCLGGELSLTKAGDSPMKDQFPPELQERIINAHLISGGLELTGSDWFLPNEQPVQGNTVCAYVSGATYDELKGYFDKLAVGAHTDHFEALHELPFGAYGALTDKFGVRWMFQGDKA